MSQEVDGRIRAQQVLMVFSPRMGCVDASRSTANQVLEAGHSVYVYPGGVPEIFLTNPYSKEVSVGWRLS